MCAAYPYHFGPRDFWRVNPDSLKVLAAPFASIAFCGSHRSYRLARLLASKDYRSAIKLYPAKNILGRTIVLEPPRRTSASRPPAGWRADSSWSTGDPRFGENVVISWLMATK